MKFSKEKYESSTLISSMLGYNGLVVEGWVELGS